MRSTGPDTVWFFPATKDEQRFTVDAHLIVTRTRDSGQHSEVLQHGLSDEPVYDLIYRRDLAISDDGKRPTFGSTTDLLWISEDQGDNWQVVSKHLPPVLCVCFDY